jgi:hypothetical protein
MCYKRQTLLTLRENLGLPPVYDGVRVAAHIASFLCCVVFNFALFVRLCRLSCVHNVACFH